MSGYPYRVPILKKLIQNKGRLLTYSLLLDSLWGRGRPADGQTCFGSEYKQAAEKNRDGGAFLYF